ncbi:MAG: hypothetical protein J2P17_29835, partial [Mycobacterium sp.]|nr:hypothetical protein [Mycobacterium sp.]
TVPVLPGARRPELAGVDAVFARALAKDPAQRFDRCIDFADALARGLQSSATGHAQPAEITLPAPTPLTAGQPFLQPPGGLPPVAPPSRPHMHRPSVGRKRVIVSGLSMLAVLAIFAGATVAVARITAGNEVKRAAQDQEAARLAGQQYLEALAAGDAQTALALGAEPPGAPQFLTDKALRAQLVTTPVTDIVVTNDASRDPAMPDDAERLVLAAKFGAVPSQTSMWVRKKSGQWKLDTTTIALSIDYSGGANEAMKAVAVSGVPTNGVSPIRVFPGTPQISSSNRYIDITAPTKPLLLNTLADTTHRPSIQPVAALNDAGRQASLDAIDARVRYCVNGGPQPAGCCPNGNCNVPPPPGGTDAGIDGDTVKVLSVENTQDMTYELDPT